VKLIKSVKFAYKDLLSETNKTPVLHNIIDRVMFMDYEQYMENIASFYLANEAYGDYERIMTEGLCKEDLDIYGVNIEYAEDQIIECLNLLNYEYIVDGKLYNPSQTTIFGW